MEKSLSKMQLLLSCLPHVSMQAMEMTQLSSSIPPLAPRLSTGVQPGLCASCSGSWVWGI